MNNQDYITGEEFGEKLLQSVREMQAGLGNVVYSPIFDICSFPSSGLGTRLKKLQLPELHQARACKIGFPSGSLGISATSPKG